MCIFFSQLRVVVFFLKKRQNKKGSSAGGGHGGRLIFASNSARFLEYLKKAPASLLEAENRSLLVLAPLWMFFPMHGKLWSTPCPDSYQAGNTSLPSPKGIGNNGEASMNRYLLLSCRFWSTPMTFSMPSSGTKA